MICQLTNHLLKMLRAGINDIDDMFNDIKLPEKK